METFLQPTEDDKDYDIAPTGDDKDYFEETSLTEYDAMNEPEFKIRLKCVKLVANGLC